jgi:hypothetical protein
LLRGGKKLWGTWLGSGGLATLDNYGVGLQLQLTKDEKDTLLGPVLRGAGKAGSLRFEADKTARKQEKHGNQWAYLVGDTYDHRALLKRFGAKWASGIKGWSVDTDQLDKLLKELAKLGVTWQSDWDQGYSATFYRLASPTTDTIAFRGKTYANKDLLKKAGARWNSDERAWTIEEQKLPKVLKTLDAAGIKYRQDGSDIWL